MYSPSFATSTALTSDCHSLLVARSSRILLTYYVASEIWRSRPVTALSLTQQLFIPTMAIMHSRQEDLRSD